MSIGSGVFKSRHRLLTVSTNAARFCVQLDKQDPTALACCVFGIHGWHVPVLTLCAPLSIVGLQGTH